MRKLFLTMLLVLGLCHPPVAPATTVFSTNENSFQFLVYQRTIDGDTIKVDVANLPEVFGKNLSVRLRGIDAPSLRGKCQQFHPGTVTGGAEVRQAASDPSQCRR